MTFPVPGGSTFMRARNNLSDVPNDFQALFNLNEQDAANQLTSGEAIINRLTGGNSPVLVSGTISFTYGTAQKTETINNLTSNTGNTAAGATPTFCGYAVYSSDAAGNLTLVAQCAND